MYRFNKVLSLCWSGVLQKRILNLEMIGLIHLCIAQCIFAFITWLPKPWQHPGVWYVCGTDGTVGLLWYVHTRCLVDTVLVAKCKVGKRVVFEDYSRNCCWISNPICVFCNEKCEMKWCDTSWDEMIWDETIWDKVRWDKTI